MSLLTCWLIGPSLSFMRWLIIGKMRPRTSDEDNLHYSGVFLRESINYDLFARVESQMEGAIEGPALFAAIVSEIQQASTGTG